MKIESRLTNTIQLALEICGWIQNYFFLKKQHKTSHTTQVQNAVIISWLFKAKPPNHTFWNSHSVCINNYTHALRGAENRTCLSHSPPECSDHHSIIERFSLFRNTAIKWNHFKQRDRASPYCRMLVALLWDVGKLESWPCFTSRGTRIWVRLLSPRWVCWPLGDCLHQDVSYSSGLVGWSMTK